MQLKNMVIDITVVYFIFNVVVFVVVVVVGGVVGGVVIIVVVVGVVGVVSWVAISIYKVSIIYHYMFVPTNTNETTIVID